ncbi:MAG: hypothetical protein ACE5NA_06135 [Nitrospiraceae bacterium]
MMKKTGLLVSLIFVLGGCQSLQGLGHSGNLQNHEFMSLWDTYSHCSTSLDVDAMRQDVEVLNEVALAPVSFKDLPLPLPKAFIAKIRKPTPRLAVDPKAMAAACSLYTGQVAHRAARYKMAGEMYQSVLQDYKPQSDYTYYASQARVGLRQLGLTADVRPVSSSTPGAPSQRPSRLSY